MIFFNNKLISFDNKIVTFLISKELFSKNIKIRFLIFKTSFISLLISANADLNNWNFYFNFKENIKSIIEDIHFTYYYSKKNL